MTIIPRPRYIDYLVSRLNRGMMLVLVGQRRVGKSYILRELKEWLEANRMKANLVYINKELREFGEITTADQLYDYVSPKLPAGAENYLLIDEVPDIEHFENALRSLYAEERCQIVVTGSNAYLFSSELSTRLSGRYIEVPVYNLSYQEFLRFYALEDSDDSLLAFMRIGGLPGLKNLDINDEAQVRDYLQGVYSTVMFKDVMARQQIRNVPFMENMSHYLADNVGKIVSAGSIAGTMISQGQKITPGAVSDYLGFLRSALLVSKVFRFDVHGRKLLERNSKYFFSDHGIRNMLCGFDMRGSIERIMENVIYLHLRQQGFEVTVGILPRAEIDFVATRGEERIYVQSSYLLASQETVKREFGNLAAIQDNYPKYVVSMDPVSGNFAAYPGIRHMRLREFLTAAL